MPLASLEQRIQREYLEGGYGLGWRLLASPVACVAAGGTAFIGLNPGGGFEDPEHAVLAPRAGSAYVTESWAGYPAGMSPLQQQVRRLFSGLGIEPEAVLAGNLVPFRSPSWASLPNKARALAFGRSIWAELLDMAQPRLIITMGGTVFDTMAELLNMHDIQLSKSGWGKVNLRSARIDAIKLVGLPHLSRYALVGRAESAAAIRSVFGQSWRL